MTLTFRNDPTLKSDLLTELAKHREHDQFIRGYYQNEEHGDDFKGCSLGCSIHSLSNLRRMEIRRKLDYGDHAAFAEAIGVPVWLVWLQDAVFEGLPAAVVPGWTERLISAIPEGVTHETLRCRVLGPFMRFVLANCRGRADANGKAVIDTVTALWSRVEAGDETTDGEWSAARAAAYAAAQSTASSATREAAWSAERAAVRGAARVAVYIAEHASRLSGRAATRAATWSRYADELVRLLEACA